MKDAKLRDSLEWNHGLEEKPMVFLDNLLLMYQKN